MDTETRPPTTVAEITTAEELDALPVGSVVEATWLTWADPSRPWGDTCTKPVSRLFMVTEHMLIAERYEVAKRGPYSALPRFKGGIRIVSRPDAPASASVTREAASVDARDAYRAFCEVRKGKPLAPGEFEATYSRIEALWIRQTLQIIGLTIADTPTDTPT